MILRIWHGYTSPSNANQYENLLTTEIIPMIKAMEIDGYQKIQVLRRELANEVEFTTIMWFNELENIKDFVGEDFETAHVPESARAVLKRYDTKAVHHELIDTFDYST